ncbi:MAG: 23S rRNA (uracil(1939)-C(5))-methyltransferase RlmD [Desulfobulbaceae bacterium]|nr:23S rRNA (uracil(1939)-C(5))-methyltransferase RlmD [Desulfobulbaceae bacterium]HIJ91429.1 23S rRNA (uracil(1939)-C(5))-methyltransferase RlmD [Deltaproteobacteria bacterium]
MTNPVELTVDKVIKGGLGLGRLTDGQVIMVPRVLPGERVRVQPRRHHKQYQEADLLEVLQPSDQRITPTCPVYDTCGGCDFQHAAYAEQLRLKNSILGETLCRARLCREEEISFLLGSPMASPKHFGYRQRIRLQVAQGMMGYFGRQSHSLIPVSRCPLAGESLNSLLADLSGNRKFHSLLDLASAIELFENPAHNTVILLIHYARKTRPTDHQTARLLCQGLPLLEAVIFNVEGQAKGPCFNANGETPLSGLRVEILLSASLCGQPLTLGLEPGGFCQVNLGQNENCISLLLEWMRSMQPGKVLDLFCGMGNFSLPLAMLGWKVTGMDMQRSTIRSAIRNSEGAGLAGQCEFTQESATRAARRLLAEKATFDCLLLDPPRSGCAELIPLLPGLNAGQIIYISCDPATLARDLRGLTQAGYRMIEVRLVDMFPQTGHLETMVRLVWQGTRE